MQVAIVDFNLARRNRIERAINLAWSTLLSETLEAFADDNIFPASTIAMKMKYIWIIGPVGAAQFILTTLVLLSSRLYQREGF